VTEWSLADHPSVSASLFMPRRDGRYLDRPITLTPNIQERRDLLEGVPHPDNPSSSRLVSVQISGVPHRHLLP
jgi:hypothetical protein